METDLDTQTVLQMIMYIKNNYMLKIFCYQALFTFEFGDTDGFCSKRRLSGSDVSWLKANLQLPSVKIQKFNFRFFSKI